MRILIILFAIILYIGFPNNLFSQVYDDIYNNPIQRTEKLDSANSTAKTYRKPSKATLLSLAYPGVGQYYNGQKDKAIGFIAWKVASDVCMIFGFYGTIDNLFSKEGETYAIIFLGSLTSAVTSWAVSMIDANLSAKKINKYNGFTNPKENKPQLSINPDIKIIPQPLSPTTQTYSPSFGLNLSLSF